MKRLAILSFLFLVAMGCKDGKRYREAAADLEAISSVKLRSILEFQQELNASYRSPETSPLPDRYRQYFESLDFFEPDTNYVVRAYFKRTPEAAPFLMPSTTDERSREVVFGIAHFTLNGKAHQLEVYQGLDLMKEEGFHDYLFLPFLDGTNGEATYGGGRYIDLRIPQGDSLDIDFNKAYNPYCVYNKKYSCPLVPRQNYLQTRVEAGVKDFVTK